MLRLFAKRWQRELYSDMVEVPSTYSIKKNDFLESKMGDRKSKMGNGKSKIGRFIEHKRKAK